MEGQGGEEVGDDVAVPADEGVCEELPEAVIERVSWGEAVEDRVDVDVRVEELRTRVCEGDCMFEGVASAEGDSDGAGLVVAFPVAVSERVAFVDVGVGVPVGVRLPVDVTVTVSDPDEVASRVRELETVSALDTELDGVPVRDGVPATGALEGEAGTEGDAVRVRVGRGGRFCAITQTYPIIRAR